MVSEAGEKTPCMVGVMRKAKRGGDQYLGLGQLGTVDTVDLCLAREG